MQFVAPCIQRRVLKSLVLSGLFAAMATSRLQAAVTYHQVEAFEDQTVTSSPPYYKYATVNFAGNPTVTTGGRTYFALDSVGSVSNSTTSVHAATVAQNAYFTGPGTTATGNVYADSADRFLVETVLLPGAGIADPPLSSSNKAPAYFGRSAFVAGAYTTLNINVSEHAYNGSIKLTGDTPALTLDRDRDAVRRIDFMQAREPKVLMTTGAAGSSTSGLVWSSYNSVAVRGTQALNPTGGPGKKHADLWAVNSVGSVLQASFTSALVSGHSAALQATAQASAPLADAFNNAVVVKSIMMTAADKNYVVVGNSWTRDTANNLSVQQGAGRANYTVSNSILTAGERNTTAVTGGTIVSPTVYTTSQGWAYNTSSAGVDRALVFQVAGTATYVDATLNWDFTQQSTTFGGLPGIDTSDAGRLYADLNLQIVPLTASGSNYLMGTALSATGLFSTLSNAGAAGPDNVEHLYYTGTPLAAGTYAFIIRSDSSLSVPFGFSYNLTLTAPLPEPTSGLLLLIGGSMLLTRRRLTETV